MSHQTNAKERQHILNYPVDLIDQVEALSVIENAWSAHKYMHVVTLNAEMIIAAQKDSWLDKIIHEANLVIADGAGVVIALKLYAHNIKRLPGIELAEKTLSLAAHQNIPVALIGGKPEVLDILRRILPLKFPGLNLVACHDGYFQLEQDHTVIESIRNNGAQLVLVAMGIPRQEYFIDLAREMGAQAVFIGVGGSFDVWSGTKRRAPMIFQKCNLEWLYRLLSEPWRLKRMGTALPDFAYQIIIEFLQNKIR